ncbi:anaerobic sulfatase maturase [Erwinia typographi]|uniref:anaerobic sulfatase maturase n=1 Tax=Erwinia typographi TaxID=371042 RepID=UPI0018DC22BA|nr:anaerobic sulfatase maturase [Erwinia typographi]
MKGCHVMAKPAGSRCNLSCRYCFYLDKPMLPVMDEETLRLYIRQHIAAQPGDEVEFAWQGGEPTLCGLPFFEKVVALQQRYACGKRIHNSLQTNGLLLNDAWCAFLRQHQWLVGLSLDGPAELHDRYRVTRRGLPSHHRVMATLNRLRRHQIAFNLMVVVNNLNGRQPEQMYAFLRQLGTPWLQFIPLVEWDAAGNLTPESVTAEIWGQFLTTVFMRWGRQDIGRIHIQLFESTLGIWNGFPSQLCVLSETCGHAFALEANGDLYQCDHFVGPPWWVGNLRQTPLSELNASRAAIAFGAAKKTALPPECLTCRERPFCHGDCPKHRPPGGKSALCEGYRRFFRESAPWMARMRDLIRRRRSPAALMAAFPAPTDPRGQVVIPCTNPHQGQA